jgi:hypothetical protein
MTEENNEMLLLMKELVDRVKSLEQQVYNKDNVLMKAGLVVHNTPTPSISNNSIAPTGDTIGKMSWNDIHKMVENAG